ncbi:MAG: class I SAM-dependent methyltransferase [Verrucomicrobiia bacterium]|jgi:predicted TPR repeat methyltransferase
MKFQGIATSNPMQISFVLDVILQLRPDSVLDIGCGSGKYGLLIRENRRTARIDAIEGFAPYVTDVHKTVYDHVEVGNAMSVVPGLEQVYDVAMMIDMFEHLTLEDGRTLLHELEKHSRHILISVPTWHPEQDAYDGNVLQEHHAQYDVTKLRALGFRQIWRVSGSYIALRGPTKVNLKRKVLKCATACLIPDWASRMLAPISRAFPGFHHPK